MQDLSSLSPAQLSDAELMASIPKEPKSPGSNLHFLAGCSSKDAVGQISVHVDITATPSTGEHKVTVKGRALCRYIK